MWKVGKRYRVQVDGRGLVDVRLYGKTLTKLVFEEDGERYTADRADCELVMELSG